jgi:hypothetical protein
MKWKKLKALNLYVYLLIGFLLNSALSSNCASGLRYSGIPNLAFKICKTPKKYIFEVNQMVNL